MTITKGDKREFSVTVTDGDGNALDLTTYTMTFTAKAKISQTDANADISKDAVINTPAIGIGVFTLLPADTRVDSGTYSFDVQISDGSTNIFTVIGISKLLISDEVTIDV